MRGDPTKAISDEALAMFVQWARLNSETFTADSIVVRGVLVAYAKSLPVERVEPVS